jgi:hypothetical protein
MLNTELDANSVVSVAPLGGAGDLNTAPQSISLGMNYYQYSKKNKQLISIDIEFGDL